MTWPKIVLIVWLAFGALATIVSIGKPRKAVTPNLAVVVVIIDAVVIALVAIA